MDAKTIEGGKEEALERLKSYELKPSIIIDSGNGYHGYWLLEFPMPTETPQQVRQVETLLKRLAMKLGADQACAEIARILRLPETKNYKDLSKPKPVEVVEFEPSRRYAARRFDSVLPAAPEAKSSSPINSDPSSLRPPEGERHTTYLKEVGSLLGRGISPEKTLALLLPHSRAVGFPDEELEAIVESLAGREQLKAEAMEAERFDGMKETEFDPTPLSESVDFLEEEVLLPSLSTATSYHFPPLYKEGEVEGEINRPTLVTFNEFITSAPLQFNWRVQGFYPEVGVNSIAAVPGVGKSWAAMDLALATATGAKWMNHFQTIPCPVLYIDFEYSHHQLSRRFRRILRAYNLSPAEVPNFNFLRADSIMLDTDKGKKVVELAMTQTGAKLVVFDSLMRIHSGEENSSTDMGKVSRSLISLANTFQACLVLVDHLGKGLGAGLRGSTEKRAALETILEFSDFGNKTIKAQVTKFRPTGEDWDPFLIKLEDPTEDSTMLRYMSMTEKDDALSRDTEVEWVLEYLKSVGGSASRQEVIRIAKQVQSWGEKRTSGVLNRGLGRELWTWVPSVNPESKRPQYTVQLTPFGLGDKLL